MRRLLILCVIFLLFAGCSKNEEASLFAPFMGMWEGVIVDECNADRSYNFKVNISPETDVNKALICAILPEYKYILFTFEGSDINKGDMLILYRSSHYDVVAKVILHSLKNKTLQVSIDVINESRYQGTLISVK